MMTFEERQNAVGTLLRETILPRYTRPAHLSDDMARAELRDMVNELVADWPVMGRTEFEATAQRMAREVRRSHEGRSWPSIKRLLAALDAATKERPASAHGGDENPQVYAGAVDWWHKHGGRCPWAKEHHAVRMEREGIASKRELWRAGWDVPSAWVDEILGRGRFSVPAVEPRRMPHAEGF